MSRAAAIALSAAASIQAAQAGQPVPWGLGLQPGASPIKHEIAWFHDALLLPVITIITLFVLALLLYTMSRFSAAKNPTPSRTSHNTTIEVLWTVIPIVILVVIAIPSFRLLYKQDRAVNPDMTIKVTGRQWYWQYEYPDHGTFVIDSRIVRDKDGKPAGEPRLLEVDNRLVVPVGATIHARRRRGRDALLLRAVARRADLLGARPPERDVVPGREGRHLLRPVQPDLRHRPRLHADRDRGRVQGEVPAVARGGEEEVRRFRRAAPAGHRLGRLTIQIPEHPRAPAPAPAP
jgi:heme/copper-type cytochrome/quinol oxidase subunit 2